VTMTPKIATHVWDGKADVPGTGYVAGAEAIGFPDRQSAADFADWLKDAMRQKLSDLGYGKPAART
jgi:hypothetical protein